MTTNEPGHPPPVGPCRHCHAPSWARDENGPIHRCCANAEHTGQTCTSGQVCRDAAKTKHTPTRPPAAITPGPRGGNPTDPEVRHSPTGRYHLRESTRIVAGLGVWQCHTIHDTDTDTMHSVHTYLADALAELARL